MGGRQFALPYQYYPWGLFTRRDVLDRAGVREAPHDLSAIMTACSKLRKAGFTPIALGAKDGWALAAWFDFIDMRANGFEYHQQLLDGKATYNDSNVRRTFAMWKQLIDAKCFDPNALAVDEHGAEAQLYAGKAGMLLMGTVVSASFPEVVRPVIDYQRFPVIDSGQAAAEAAPTDTFQVAARAKNKADARRFLKFAASSAASAKLAKSIGSFPTNKFAPVAGTVLDLASYKVLTDAKGNLVQGFDRDVPADMAAAGIKGFQEFFAKPDQMYAVMNRLDAVRGTAYAAVGRTRRPRPARTARTDADAASLLTERCQQPRVTMAASSHERPPCTPSPFARPARPRLRVHAPCRPSLPPRPAAARPPPVDRRVAGDQARGLRAHRLPRRGRPARPGRADRGRGRRRLPPGRRLRPAAADVHHARGPGPGGRRPARAGPARSLAGVGCRGRAGQDHRRAAAGRPRGRRIAAAVCRALGHRLRSIERLGLLRDAASTRRRIRFDYEDAEGAATSRTARPLGCYHWEAVWTLAAWCEHRTAFRSFRIDRMRTLDVLDDVFRDEPGRTLPDFLRHVKARPWQRPAGAEV